MQNGEKVSVELTEKEWELIQTIRNYQRAYPNGSKIFIAYIEELIGQLLDRN